MRPAVLHGCTLLRALLPAGCARYIIDTGDIEAEREATVAVKRAAAEALAEANTKLKQAEAAQQQLTMQLESARALTQVRISKASRGIGVCHVVPKRFNLTMTVCWP
jgi:hypothetical protein